MRKDDHDGNDKRVITAPTAGEGMKTVEKHALHSGIGPGTKDHWQFVAAQTMHRWPEGKELSAEEFARAIADATTAPIR